MSDMSEAPRLDSVGEDSISRMVNNRQFRLLADIPVRMSVEVGSTSLRLAEVMDLSEGSVVELDRQADDLLDIMVNGALIAKGEVVTVNGRYGIRIVEIAAAESRLAGVERRG
ncbi:MULTISPECIES: flagellar motor switch protein FliN [Sphingobium]|jgi:flagellar motor switch protein FliN/FliY|uniref:Flagellar motor switch protein FliN n=2 Tax=Sphingobium fuliginis (strain ATCC 27551) TaxID=336203 RepID=A0A292ZJE0_SPHSA|nr:MULTISPECIES: flagellar motor switch protein FliN [Sphingobium]OAP29696.1 flagellar motor switch protein FliN [Sphingobium sp. 20006FA]AJR22801.1 flagellar motor switch protein FliN [Sphingobium sp. YBL2]KXU31839.1 flagellar motor switch protein FliN [Sphingobium sp. AM]KYC30080.1 flagellar motor switch protein FliN [Sphingobium sp. 22B]MCB4859055.1 flagellar motor switch protein FliN [Sphingobium sp. PNB]